MMSALVDNVITKRETGTVLIRTPTDLGAAIRDQRRRRGLDQQALARKVGVSRQWVVEVEKGRARAQVGLILRTLDALGIALALAGAATSGGQAGPSSIDQVIDNARRPE